MRHLSLITFCLFLVGCSGYKVNNDTHIDSGIRKEIEQLNKQVINGMNEGRPEVLIALCSDDLLKLGKDTLANLVKNTKGQLNISAYSVAHQFHVKTSAKNTTIPITSGTGVHDYTINFIAVNTESVITHIDIKDDRHTLSLLTIFGSYNKTWKLVAIRIAETKFLGMDAFDWYQKAASTYKKGALVDAANLISLSANLANSMGSYFRYQKVGEMTKLYEKIFSEANRKYKFPYIVAGISTHPSIFRVTPIVLPGQFCNMIQYNSKIKLSDTVALAKECDSINHIIGSIFKGINTENDTIAYRAFNEIPSDKREYQHYGFIRRTEK